MLRSIASCSAMPQQALLPNNGADAETSYSRNSMEKLEE